MGEDTIFRIFPKDCITLQIAVANKGFHFIWARMDTTLILSFVPLRRHVLGVAVALASSAQSLL